MNKRLVVKTIKESITVFLEKTRGYKLFSPFYSGCGTILMFHRVIQPEAAGRPRMPLNKSMEVSPAYLEEIIGYCKRHGYQFLTPGELPSHLRDKDRQKNKFVCFTFDDGYADVYTTAYPVFKKLNVPFTVYIATDFPDKKILLWWYAIEDILMKNERVDFSYNGIALAYDLKTPQQREKAFFDLRSRIFGMEMNVLRPFLENFCLAHKTSLQSYTDNLTMSWEQIRKLSEDPLVTIGSHTLSHMNMRFLSAGALLREIMESKSRIEAATGRVVRHFSYPFGNYEAAGEREFEYLKDSDYQTAVTTRNTHIFPAHADHLFCLPRIGIDGNNETIAHFDLLMSGALSAFQYLFKRVITKE